MRSVRGAERGEEAENSGRPSAVRCRDGRSVPPAGGGRGREGDEGPCTSATKRPPMTLRARIIGRGGLRAKDVSPIMIEVTFRGTMGFPHHQRDVSFAKS